jgi:hypothetical protein
MPTRNKDLPAVPTDQRCSGSQLFALVDAVDPDRVYYYGIDVGSGAFTVRRDPESHRTDFGSWISMQTAFERLDGLAGGPGRLVLVVFDSVPVAAVTAIDRSGPALAVAPVKELEAIYLGKYAAVFGRDPQADEDQLVQGVNQRTKAL